MANFFSKLFGKDKSPLTGTPEQVVEKSLDGILDRGGFDLSFEIEQTEEGMNINFSGADSKLMTAHEGLLLDSFQIYLKRLLQNKFQEKKIEISVDCDGFLESSAKELQQLAERLKKLVIEKGTPSYVRALPPRDRKVVHRHLALDERVKSQSVGEGFCKKIKISLAKNESNRSRANEENFA